MESFKVNVNNCTCQIQFNSQAFLNQNSIVNLNNELDTIEQNKVIKVVILTGEKKVFSRGQEVSEIYAAYENQSSSYAELLKNNYHRIINKIRNSSKIYIAVVNGMAIGAGISLALACDIIIASPKALFYAPYTDLGLIPDGGILYFLLKTIGYYKTYELACLKNRFTANEAYELGLINYLEDEDHIYKRAQQLAIHFSTNHAISSLMKSYFNENVSKMDIQQALDCECRYQDLARQTTEHQLAMNRLTKKE